MATDKAAPAVQPVAAQSAPLPAIAPAAASAPAAVAAGSSTGAADASQTTALTPDEAKQNAVGNVAELQQLIHSSDLTELRTTYNGSYGASLLFYAKDMTYYVALFQQKTFWRVIKTSDDTRAEAVYRDFVRQTSQLADIEIRRTKIEAQKELTERMIELSQARESRLQADLAVARQQQAVVADQQKQTRAQADSLQAQRTAALEQLHALQRQVRRLQQEVEGGLPAR